MKRCVTTLARRCNPSDITFYLRFTIYDSSSVKPSCYLCALCVSPRVAEVLPLRPLRLNIRFTTAHPLKDLSAYNGNLRLHHPVLHQVFHQAGSPPPVFPALLPTHKPSAAGP